MIAVAFSKAPYVPSLHTLLHHALSSFTPEDGPNPKENETFYASAKTVFQISECITWRPRMYHLASHAGFLATLLPHLRAPRTKYNSHFNHLRFYATKRMILSSLRSCKQLGQPIMYPTVYDRTAIVTTAGVETCQSLRPVL